MTTNTPSFAVKNRWIVMVAVMAVIAGLYVLAFLAPEYHLTELRFNPYGALSAAVAVLAIGLLVYFLRKTARSEERIWLVLYLFIMVFYVSAEAMQRFSASPVATLFWSNASTPVVLVAPVIFLFALTYTNQSERRYPGITGLLLISAAVILFFENWTYVVFINKPGLAELQPWGWDFRETTLAAGSYLVALWYYVILTAAVVRLIGFRRHTRNVILRRQSLIFILAVAIPLGGGVMTDLILPTLGVTVVSPVGILIAVAAFVFIVGVVRYQLVTINPTQFSGTILDIMQDAVVVTDTNFTVLYVNPEGEKTLGLSPNLSKRGSLISKISEHSTATFNEAFASEQAKRKATLDIDHIDIESSGGGRVPVRVRCSWLQLGTGVEVLVIILTDISKELQTRSVIEHEVQLRTNELNEARAYLVSSINSLEQGFILLNNKGHIELANGMAAARLQTPSDKLVGVDFTEAAKVLPWDVDLAKSTNMVFESRRARQLKINATDGTFFVTYITPVLHGEHVLGVTVVIQDVTEQRILDRSKDEFFSIASHELRTPLTAIRGNMSIAQEYFAKDLNNKDLAGLVSDTRDASVRLIEIVNDFLDSSRLEQGKMLFDIKPVDLKPLVASIQNDVEAMLAKQNDTFTVEGLAKSVKVMADEGRVRQVIYNLLTNAIKYNSGAAITLAVETDKNKVHIRVSDTGRGISPEHQKLLFHKFQQAGDMLTRDDTKGTGLGLYIARLLVENMHGTVELERSEENKGSTFLVTLPVAHKG